MERVKVIERNKAGESMKKIADSLGVGKTQIQSIIKNTQTILDSWENGDWRMQNEKPGPRKSGKAHMM